MISSSSHDPDEDDPSDLQHGHHVPQPPGFVSQAIHTRQLLISCAQFISQSDYASAHRLISLLSANSSPHGETSTERLAHYFVKALSLRLSNTAVHANATTSSQSQALHSCFLSLNQITPFIRFSHLTANQAILEAAEGQQAIHILDFDVMQGVQWPPFMQAIAERSVETLQPPPTLRITGTGQDLDMLHKTGERLLVFAQSLGLKFEFHPLVLLENDSTSASLYFLQALAIHPDEFLAVNCVLYLHRLLKDDLRDLRLFLHNIKALNPKIVTIAEREASHNHPLFLQRFVEAIEYYTAVFDSLEATLPPNSKERLEVEQIWFGREIMDIVAAEGNDRKERHERFEWWEVMLRSAGFTNAPLSSFALSQAKLLLRLHYPSEGYQLQVVRNSFFLDSNTAPWQRHAEW